MLSQAMASLHTLHNHVIIQLFFAIHSTFRVNVYRGNFSTLLSVKISSQHLSWYFTYTP